VRGNRRLIGSILGVAGVLLLAAVVVAVALSGGDDETEGPPQPLSVSSVVSSPASYFRRTVGLSGEVSEVLGPRAVLLGGREFQGGDSLLVVSEEPITSPRGGEGSRPVVENDILSAVGKVRLFDRRELEDQLGAPLSKSLARFDEEPVLVARWTAVTPRLLAPRGVVPVDDIVDRPRAHIGELVSVQGRVSDVLDGGAFVLDRRLLVVGGGGEAEGLRPGDRVRLVAAVRPLDPDQAPRRGALDEQLFGELSQRPVLIADSITRTAGDRR
jgi:hypothetical protein